MESVTPGKQFRIMFLFNIADDVDSRLSKIHNVIIKIIQGAMADL